MMSQRDELDGGEETDRFDINDPESLRLADLHLVFPDKLQQRKKSYHELRHAGGWAEQFIELHKLMSLQAAQDAAHVRPNRKLLPGNMMAAICLGARQ